MAAAARSWRLAAALAPALCAATGAAAPPALRGASRGFDGQIVSADGPVRCLDAGEGPSNGTRVRLADCSASPGQRFTWGGADRSIRLTAQPGLCLDLQGQVLECGADASFEVSVDSDGNLSDVFLCIGEPEDPQTNDAPVSACEGEDEGQAFAFSEGQIALKASSRSYAVGYIFWTDYPSKCFQVAGGMPRSGSPIQLWDCIRGRASQQFMYNSEEQLLRWLPYPFLCATPYGRATPYLLQIAVCSQAAEINMYRGRSSVSLGRFVSSGLCTEVEDQSTRNGAAIQVAECRSYNYYQTFTFR